jgi:hypothetical protein
MRSGSTSVTTVRLGLAASAAALALAATVSTSVAAQSCTAAGYAIAVTAADGSVLDSAFLSTAVRAIALRWQTPSGRRGSHLQWRRVRERTLPDIPRWADDWRPEAAHRAEVVIVLRRRGRPTINVPDLASGEAAFDRSLESIVRDPMPASPDLPTLPSNLVADTLALRISFGANVADGPGVIRFAAAQTAVLVTPGSLVVAPPRQPAAAGQRPSATVKYDVTVEGHVDPRSIQILDADPRELGRNIQDALVRARFTPATTNCVPIRMSVLQNFGG